MANWNPWHGCHKISSGCKNCYVYRSDAKYGRDSSIVEKNKSFDLPLKRNRQGGYKLCGGEVVYTCFTSDFFVPDADAWRKDIWNIIKARADLEFFFITKRIDRFHIGLPNDWGDGYENVAIGCTVENQDMADFRLPIFFDAPIKHKTIACEPLLERIDISKYLNDKIEMVVAGGESGSCARLCDYEWILDLRSQCVNAGVPYVFKQTGARFKKGERFYNIPRKMQHSQAKRAGINTGVMLTRRVIEF